MGNTDNERFGVKLAKSITVSAADRERLGETLESGMRPSSHVSTSQSSWKDDLDLTAPNGDVLALGGNSDKSHISSDAPASSDTQPVVAAAPPLKSVVPVKPSMTHLPTTPNLHVYRTDEENAHQESEESKRKEAASAAASALSKGIPESEIAGGSAVSIQEPAAPAQDHHSQFDLLEWFNKKTHDESYRDMKFNAPKDKLALLDEYNRRVSFDTVNLQVEGDGDDDDDDEGRVSRFGSEEDEWPSPHKDERGRQLSRQLSPVGSPLQLSPGGGHSRSPVRMLSPSRSGNQIDITEFSKYFKQAKIEYPTRPIVTHRGCTYTREHPKFQDLYLKKIPGRKPILPGRLILLYLSGRKHTWVALDWVLNHFLEDGDRIVVVSAINSKQMLKPDKGRRASAFAPPIAMTPKMRLRQRNRPEFIKVIARNIMEYIMCVMNPNVIAKVSIELAVGRTKDVLKGMYKLYEPNLVCAGTKQNFRNSAPLKSWLSSKLTDRLVKNFPLPVIAVPAMNMNKFEMDLQADLDRREADAELKASNSPYNRTDQIAALASIAKGDTVDTDDVASIESDNSVNSGISVSSDESYSSYEEISKLYRDYRSDITKRVAALSLKPIDEDYYTNMLKTISDKSSELCVELQGIDPDFRGKGAKVARAITGSNSFGVVPYKTKSLLDPVEVLPPPKSNLPPGISFKETKRNLRMNSLRDEANKSLSPPGSSSSLPQIHVDSPESDGGRRTSLKFVNLQTPSSSKLQQEKEEKKKAKSSKSLQKSLSYDQDDGHSAPRPKLEPLKSHPDITSHMKDIPEGYDEDTSSKKKSKKHKFWKIFS